MRPFLVLVPLLLGGACGGPQVATMGDDVDAGVEPSPDATAESCADVGDSDDVIVGSATTADDYALTLPASSESATSWGTAGNEAVILEVHGRNARLIGHLVLHQGHTSFAYTMHLGALEAGEPISVTVSALSAPQALRKACVGPGTLEPVSALGAAGEGIQNAPIFRWPVAKRFNDIPLVLGWSNTRDSYQTVFSNEDGGTAMLCGGGASGIQAEVARWGRASDIEGSYGYAGGAPHWERCTGTVAAATTPIRTEGAHPILYYGDGHNRLFESRAGYGQACGTGSAEKPNGNLDGWNINNPGNDLAHDPGRVIILRPLPVDMDALGYATYSGRREALGDHYAPWLYRLTALELARENKIDNTKAFSMSRYLYVDVRVADVSGSGDQYCAASVTGGFKLRAVTTDGTMIDSPQITGDYASGHNWKRVAIALPAGVRASDIDHFMFDAYDGDGIYLTAIGDAFIPIADSANGASIDYVRQGTKVTSYYIDDLRAGCTNDINTSGPGGTPSTCTGTLVTIAK